MNSILPRLPYNMKRGTLSVVSELVSRPQRNSEPFSLGLCSEYPSECRKVCMRPLLFSDCILTSSDILRKQAQTPALASIMRNRRVQFLPVQWRASMKFDLDAEAQSQGHDNHFTLSEVTPKGSIAYIREMTNSVLTDIPLFMSHHRERMIESVCSFRNQGGDDVNQL